MEVSTSQDGPQEQVQDNGNAADIVAQYGEQTRLLTEENEYEITRVPPPPSYANKDLLSRYIPELNPEHPRAVTLRVKMSKKGVMLKRQMTAAAVVFLLNLGLLIAAMIKYPPDLQGKGTFLFSDCAFIDMLNGASHVALNVLSSLFLGAGNYCMQVLVAPTRTEIDVAHGQGVALDVGIPSVKNLWYVQKSKVAGWLVIGAVSTLLHFVWNSAIFSSFPLVAIPRAVVTRDFLEAGDDWGSSDPLAGQSMSWWKNAPGFGEYSMNKSAIYALQDAASNFTRLSTRDCVRRYVDPMTSSGSVIVVARDISSSKNNGSSLLDGWLSSWEVWTGSASWVCSTRYQPSWKYCSWSIAKEFADSWEVQLNVKSLAGPDPVAVDYCLAGPQGDNRNKCGLHYSGHILGIVCGCTLVEALLICWVWLQYRRACAEGPGAKRDSQPIITIGDAVQSFLVRSDRHLPTAMGVFASEALTPLDSSLGPIYVKETIWLSGSHVRWYRAVGSRAWCVSMMFFAAGLGVPGYYAVSSAKAMKATGIDVSISGIWNQGLGMSQTAITTDLGSLSPVGMSSVTALLAEVLIANTLQVMVSFLYMFFNSILTRQVVTDEFLRFLQQEGKKPLRVSSPLGMQRSSYFLSLPWKYAVPLMASTMALHWLISQSLFLAQSSVFAPGPHGERLPMYDFSARGYNLLGAAWALGLGFCMVLGTWTNSLVQHWKDIPTGFERMGFNSAALGVLSRRPFGDTDAHLFPIRIGIVQEDEAEASSNRRGKLVFSTDIRIQEPQVGLRYIRPFMPEKRRPRWDWFWQAIDKILPSV